MQTRFVFFDKIFHFRHPRLKLIKHSSTHRSQFMTVDHSSVWSLSCTTYTYMRTNIRSLTQTQTHVHTLEHVHAQMHIYAHEYVNAHVHIHVQLYTHVYIRMHAYTHSCTHMFVHIHANMRANTHIYRHTHILTLLNTYLSHKLSRMHVYSRILTLTHAHTH